MAHLAASSCGTLLAAAGGEQVVRIWDVRRPEKCILKVHVGGAEQGQGQAEQGSSGASALHYSSEEQLLAVASKSDCCVRVYDIRQVRHRPVAAACYDAGACACLVVVAVAQHACVHAYVHACVCVCTTLRLVLSHQCLNLPPASNCPSWAMH